MSSLPIPPQQRSVQTQVPGFLLFSPMVRGAVAASITQTTSIYLDANVISPQRSFWNNLHRNCLYMLNEKCSDFSEWDLNYNPTTCGSALFTLFIKQGGKKGDAVNYKAITRTATANLLPCAEGTVALDLGRTCLRATCPSPRKGP